MFAIIGSGFGLYGYLPALVECCTGDIILPARYRPVFCARPELQRFSRRVKFAANEDEALDLVCGAVIAQLPIDQVDWIARCLRRTKIQQLILEKPLAASPVEAANLLDVLFSSKRAFRIGYVFRHTLWGKRFLHAVSGTERPVKISIRWEFMAHHFRHHLQNWKRFTLYGGGAIRFYGIQIIALAAEAGFTGVAVSRATGRSPQEIESWRAVFTGSGLVDFEVAIDTRSATTTFQAKQCGDIIEVFADLKDPFDLPSDPVPHPPAVDRRVNPLGDLCRSLSDEWTHEYQWYDATNRLWRAIEDATEFETTGPRAKC